jgi:hypothetical protein
MKAEIEGIQRRSEMNVIRQRKRNQDTQEQTLTLQQEILDKIDKLQISHDELKKQIAPKKKTTAKKKKE